MRKISFAIMSASLLLSGQTLAARTSGNADSAAKATKTEKLVCKRLATTGSRMEERVCLTREQWKKVDEEVAG